MQKGKWLAEEASQRADHYIYYCGQDSLWRIGGALIVNKRAITWYLGATSKMISVHFQEKSFNITVIQVYIPTTDSEKDEVDWFYEDLQYQRGKKKKKIAF